MVDTVFDLSICLKIETNESIEYISNVLNFYPTDFIIKGESKSKVLPKSENNIWMYTQKYRNCSEIGMSFQNFIKSIPQIYTKMKVLKDNGTVTIRMSVISDFAQIGFNLSATDICLLNRLEIPIEISIFSWGQCFNE